MSGRLYLHSFWTRPCFATEAAWRTEDIVVWDFEMVTWLVSALQARRHGRIRLVTDSRGLQFARRSGIDWVYNGGISTELDEIPGGLNPEIFWAAAKLYGLRRVQEPVVSMDTDAIFWEPFEPKAPVMALHPEDLRWPWYVRNQEQYARLGFAGDEWDWALPPYTTGILYLESPGSAHDYAEAAIRFMERLSEEVRGHPDPVEEYGDAMLFAEQRVLPMCMARLGQPVMAIGRLRPGVFLLEKNPLCSHLWTSKRNYRQSYEARESLVRFLVDHVRREHPEGMAALNRWGVPGARSPAPERDPRQRPGSGLNAPEFHLLGQVKGVVSIIDPNVEARRPAYSGAVVLPGESVEGEPGSSFELMTGGSESVMIVNPAAGLRRKEC